MEAGLVHKEGEVLKAGSETPHVFRGPLPLGGAGGGRSLRDAHPPSGRRLNTRPLALPRERPPALGPGTLPSLPGAHQVLDDLLDALLGCLHAVLGPLEGDLVALRAGAWEANHHAAVLLSDLAQNLASPDDKVTVVLGVHQHVVFNHVVLRRCEKGAV